MPAVRKTRNKLYRRLNHRHRFCIDGVRSCPVVCVVVPMMMRRGKDNNEEDHSIV